MNNKINQTPQHPLKYAWRNFVTKLFQSPEVYPIKFYMKGSRMRRRYLHLAR